MLIDKYHWQLEEDQMYQVTRGIGKGRFFEAQNRSDLQPTRHSSAPLYRSGIRDNAKSLVY
jgi:hypothetical protein